MSVVMIVSDLSVGILMLMVSSSIFMFIYISIVDSLVLRYTKWCMRLVSRKYIVRRLRMVKVLVLNMRNGFCVMVKMVGMELMVNIRLVVLMIMMMSSSGVVIYWLVWRIIRCVLWYFCVWGMVCRSYFISCELLMLGCL